MQLKNNERVLLMKTMLISLQSATYAIKAKRVLNRNGVSAKPVKLDGTKSKNGCTHGIEIFVQDFYNAVMILKNEDIEYFVY